MYGKAVFPACFLLAMEHDRVVFCHHTCSLGTFFPPLANVSQCRAGYNVGGLFVNILAYADDSVLLAPSWYDLQVLSSLWRCQLGKVPRLS